MPVDLSRLGAMRTWFVQSWKGLEFKKSFEKSLNSAKVLEKYLSSLLGLEKFLNFTILSMPDTRFL